MADHICLADGCDRPGTRRKMCTMHYQRWRRHGDVAALRPNAVARCSIEACERPHYARGWCKLHWERWGKTGDPLVTLAHFSPLTGMTADLSPHWGGDEIGYHAVHVRIRKARGRAAAHACAHCEGVAADWAYTHGDPDERKSEEGPYSVDPDFYIPLCKRCHKAFDAQPRA